MNTAISRGIGKPRVPKYSARRQMMEFATSALQRLHPK